MDNKYTPLFPINGQNTNQGQPNVNQNTYSQDNNVQPNTYNQNNNQYNNASQNNYGARNQYQSNRTGGYNNANPNNSPNNNANNNTSNQNNYSQNSNNNYQQNNNYGNGNGGYQQNGGNNYGNNSYQQKNNYQNKGQYNNSPQNNYRAQNQYQPNQTGGYNNATPNNNAPNQSNYSRNNNNNSNNNYQQNNNYGNNSYQQNSNNYGNSGYQQTGNHSNKPNEALMNDINNLVRQSGSHSFAPKYEFSGYWKDNPNIANNFTTYATNNGIGSKEITGVLANVYGEMCRKHETMTQKGRRSLRPLDKDWTSFKDRLYRTLNTIAFEWYNMGKADNVDYICESETKSTGEKYPCKWRIGTDEKRQKISAEIPLLYKDNKIKVEFNVYGQITDVQLRRVVGQGGRIQAYYKLCGDGTIVKRYADGSKRNPVYDYHINPNEDNGVSVYAEKALKKIIELSNNQSTVDYINGQTDNCSFISLDGENLTTGRVKEMLARCQALDCDNRDCSPNIKLAICKLGSNGGVKISETIPDQSHNQNQNTYQIVKSIYYVIQNSSNGGNIVGKMGYFENGKFTSIYSSKELNDYFPYLGQNMQSGLLTLSGLNNEGVQYYYQKAEKFNAYVQSEIAKGNSNVFKMVDYTRNGQPVYNGSTIVRKPSFNATYNSQYGQLRYTKANFEYQIVLEDKSVLGLNTEKTVAVQKWEVNNETNSVMPVEVFSTSRNNSKNGDFIHDLAIVQHSLNFPSPLMISLMNELGEKDIAKYKKALDETRGMNIIQNSSNQYQASNYNQSGNNNYQPTNLYQQSQNSFTKNLANDNANRQNGGNNNYYSNNTPNNYQNNYPNR